MTGICMHGMIEKAEKPAGLQNTEGGTGDGRTCSRLRLAARGPCHTPSSCARCGPCGDTTRALARELDEWNAPAQIKSTESHGKGRPARGPGEEEVKRSKRGRCVGAVETTGRRPLPERQTNGRRARGAQNRLVVPAIYRSSVARQSQWRSCCLLSLLLTPPYLHRR
ncbi:hypothetical protein B0H14DRAFT_2945171, partial [Mycena olivaceomarginata]